MKSLLTTLAAAAVLVGPLVTVVRADISAEEVRKAIQDGVKFLERQQKPDGHWEDFTGLAGGDDRPVYAGPAQCGRRGGRSQRRPRAPRLHKLESMPNLAKTYARSLQTMVFCRANPQKYLIQIKTNADWLQKNQLTRRAEPRGLVLCRPRSLRQRRQFQQPVRPAGALRGPAGRRAARANIHVNDRTWRLAKAYWEGCQNLDGSWGYHKDQYGTGSMTCAGITSLIIAGDMVHQADAKADGDHIQCCGQGDVENDRIEQGDDLAGKTLHRDRESRRTASGTVVALLPLRRGTRRSAHRPAVHRRPRLVPRGRRLV